MIQSIGMTKRQLRKMLMFEGLLLCRYDLLASYVLGSLTVGVIVRALVAGGYSTIPFHAVAAGNLYADLDCICNRDSPISALRIWRSKVLWKGCGQLIDVVLIYGQCRLHWPYGKGPEMKSTR